MMEENGSSRSVQHHYYTCCWPPGRWGILFCGTALVVTGAAWLFSNLGLIAAEWWEVVVPLLLIGWGAAIVVSTRSNE